MADGGRASSPVSPRTPVVVPAASGRAIQVALRIKGQAAKEPTGYRSQNLEFGLRPSCRHQRDGQRDHRQGPAQSRGTGETAQTVRGSPLYHDFPPKTVGAPLLALFARGGRVNSHVPGFRG